MINDIEHLFTYLLALYVFFWGACIVQSVKHLTSAQVMISQFVSSIPTSGSVLTAQSLEPASDSVSPSLSAPSPAHTLSLSLSQNKTLKKIFLSREKLITNLETILVFISGECPDPP